MVVKGALMIIVAIKELEEGGEVRVGIAREIGEKMIDLKRERE